MTAAPLTGRFAPGGRWLPAVLLALGIAIRLIVWHGNRSLWIDEATVAIGNLWKPFAATWGTHDFGQISPFGWLSMVRLATELFGPSEPALRLPTLLLAIGYLPAVWLLVRHLAGERAGLLALAFTAVSPALVRYSVELKPYGAEPLITVGVIAAFIHLIRRPLSVPAALGFGLLVGLGCWVSSAAVIVVAGGIPSVILAGTRRGAFAPDVWRRVLLGAVIGAAFSILYLGHLRLEPWLQAYVTAFWERGFLDPGGPQFARRIWVAAMDLVSPTYFGHGGDLIPALLLVAIGFGVRQLIRIVDGPTVRMLTGPILILVGLAAVRIFPMGTRLSLFLAPILTLFLATGLAHWFEAARRPWFPALVIAALLLNPASATYRMVVDPIGYQGHARVVLEEMTRQRQPQDLVYVFARATPEWFFYTTDWRQPDRTRIALVEAEYRYPNGRTSASGLPRGHAPAPIGDDLRYVYRGATEVYGQYSGYIWRMGFLEHRSVDPGWALAERERILRVRPTCVWLVGLHTAKVERAALRAAMVAGGYREWLDIAAGGSNVARTCRDRPR